MQTISPASLNPIHLAANGAELVSRRAYEGVTLVAMLLLLVSLWVF